MTETRTLYDSPNYMRNHDATKIEQSAIPWCTTHNEQRPNGDHQDRCWFSWRYQVLMPDGEIATGECNISLGGLDHKWWQDT